MDSNLCNCPLFKGLDAEMTETSLQKITFQRKRYDADTIIAQRGEECDRLLIVVSGEVRGEMEDKTGKKIKIEDIKAPSPVASAFVFGNQNRFPVTITATIETEMLIIYRQELLKLFQIDAQILSNYLTIISNRAQFLSNKIRFLSFGTIREKLAHYILIQSGERLNSFKMEKTQNQLADLFGVQRPSIGRTLKELQDEGMITLSAKTITITDKEKLKALVG